LYKFLFILKPERSVQGWN